MKKSTRAVLSVLWLPIQVVLFVTILCLQAAGVFYQWCTRPLPESED